jgi:hypothetical protein
MAATRQDEHADPAMDPAEDPNLLVEQEGEGEPQNEGQNKEIVANEWELGEAQYQFDDKEDTMEDILSCIDPAHLAQLDSHWIMSLPQK